MKKMNLNTTLISPSILAADLLNLEKELKKIESSGAQLVHVDVMDGHFVPNLSFGVPLVKELKSRSKLPLDVHIMVTNPDESFDWYASAGAALLSFHIEAAKHPLRICQELKNKGVLCGVAINPGTPIEALSALIPHIDYVNVMSVNPGFSGQKFIENTFDRIKGLSLMIKNQNSSCAIKVDGGVNKDNVSHLKKMGANIFVTGQSFFKSDDPKAFVDFFME